MVPDPNYTELLHEFCAFQSALRFAVVSDMDAALRRLAAGFQSALRFAVVSDDRKELNDRNSLVSIRFEVRGGFRRSNP